jgi:superfamily II DNA or RNA helicase
MSNELEYGENEVVVFKLDESVLKVLCFQSIAMEINEAYSFLMDGYKFSPLFKQGRWDGYIRIFSLGKRTLPSGLYSNLVSLCESRGWQLRTVNNPQNDVYGLPNEELDLSKEECQKYVEDLNIYARGEKLNIDDFQHHGIYQALLKRQCILEAATSAGKSLMVYSIARYITEELDGRMLILVPTVGLTTQFKSDFQDYSSQNGWDVDGNIHLISAGIEKITKKRITISTFQSLSKEDSEYFNSFTCIMTDEGHKITADTFKNIYGKATEVPYRLACTGTLQELKCNLLQMIGLTGPVVHVINASELISRGRAVPLKVKALQLNYSQEWCAAMKKADYDQEITWLSLNPRRNNFISKLSTRLKGTTLVMFNYADHGKLLYEKIKELAGDTRPVYIIDGNVKKDRREEIRQLASLEDCIIVASLKTMAAGVNMPAIENIVYAHPTKGKIQYIQTLGRGLRLKKGKTHCNLYDIGDNLTYKRKPNNTFRHFGIRMETLAQEGHEFETVMIDFN